MKNKYFSAALFYDECRTMITAVLCNVFFMSLISCSLISYPERLIIISENSYKITLPLFFLFAIPISAILTSYNTKDVKYSFMLTQPYSKDAIILTKTLAVVLTYLIPLLLTGITLSTIILQNKDMLTIGYFAAIKALFLYLLSTFAIGTFIIMLIQLMQMLFGKTALGVVMPFGLAVIIFISGSIIYAFASDKLPFIRGFLDFFIRLAFGSPKTNEKGLLHIISNYLQTNNLNISLLLIAISVIMLFICIHLNRRIKFENISGAYMFKFSERLTNVVGSIFIVTFSTLLLLILATFISRKFTGASIPGLLSSRLNSENAVEIGKLIINIAWIPLMIYTYRFVDKLSQKRMVV